MIINKLPQKCIKYLTDKSYRFQINANLHLYDSMPDEEYLKKMFFAKLGKELDLDNPKTFNEKLQWLKLYNRKPEYTTMVDKYAVKEYIKNKIGEEYIVPLLCVWDNPDEVDFDSLPNQFVLKCNHNSGRGMYICKDKNQIDRKKVIADLKKGLKENYYMLYREWPYKNVKPRIIAEGSADKILDLSY